MMSSRTKIRPSLPQSQRRMMMPSHQTKTLKTWPNRGHIAWLVKRVRANHAIRLKIRFSLCAGSCWTRLIA